MRASLSSYLAAWSALSIPGLLAYKISQIPFMPSFGRTSHENNVHRLPDWNYDLHALEPIPLAVNGNSTNRVNLVYFGDGYTEEERHTFIRDAQFLTDTLMDPGGAFSPVATLLNFWAVFIPSGESGIGTHGKPRNTTFGLYRPGEELRAVFYAHPERVAAACKALNQRSSRRHGTSVNFGCDEPILLGNDGFYGGLGGTPTVITASGNNGVQVLRHELGHTLIPVGEEYDGGFAYFGVNAANASERSAKQDVSWAHWFSDLKAQRTGRVRIEDSRVAVQKYPWHDLSRSPYAVHFSDHGADYPTGLLRFSVSGIPDKTNLVVKMDGQVVDYDFTKEHHGSLDRTWVQIALDRGLTGYSAYDNNHHKLEFDANAASVTVKPMLSSVEIIEYGSNERFNGSAGHIGAYRTEDIDGGITLRPTNEGCLMRDVTIPTFCSVCLEGLTLSLFSRVSLIESTRIMCPAADGKPAERHAAISLNLLNITDASYTVRWFRGDVEIHGFGNKTTVDIPVSLLQPERKSVEGMYTAKVKLALPLVRRGDREEMQDKTDIWFGGCH